LGSNTTRIAIDRDWIIVIARSLSADFDSHEKNNLKFKNKLTEINANVKRIELNTGIVSNLVTSGIISNIDEIWLAFFCAFNIFSLCIEYKLLLGIYNELAELKKGGIIKTNNNGRIKQTLYVTLYGWKVFFNQGNILLLSIGLSIGYLNTLNFDWITIGKEEDFLIFRK
jgi:hypothetical protein